MLDAVPRNPRALHKMADVHGGYLNLIRWGSLFYARGALLRVARRRTRHSHLVFLTGTQGKTTLLRAVRLLLDLPVDRWSDANTNCRGEVPWSVLRIPRDAPVIPLEVPDGNGELPVFIEGLPPDSAVVLNVGREHVDLLGSFEAVVSEFRDLVARLPAHGWAVLNADDPYLENLPTRARVITFGRSPDADVRILDAYRVQGRLAVEVEAGGQRYTARTQLVGLHYQHVVAACVAWGSTVGIGPAEVTRRLSELPCTPSRLQPFTSARGATILSDDYKATPETVRAGLAEIGQWPGQTKWAVLGELTNLPAAEAPEEYDSVARAAAAAADEVVTFGEGWVAHAHVWNGLEVRVRHADSVLAAADPVMMGHGPLDLIYVKGTEDVRPRRITLRLVGLDVRCSKPECKKTLVLCEDCPALT
jgi:UDP-N-acetylmuramoyl-tripeptide--D-alanyl-D-alanine ligase